LLTEHPAKFLQVEKQKGKLAVGYDADLIVWNPDEEFEVKPADILHRYNCSPYNGQKLFGTTQQTIVNGVTVFIKGRIAGKEKKQGKIILAETNKL
jgi:allantoinase